jgi:uncharacterized protein
MVIRAKAAPLALLALTLSAIAAPAADFTVPPAPVHYVTDNANALSSSTRASLDSELRGYESATGHQVIVWIGKTTGDVPLETWTGETADHWKIGRKGHDDGAVLFLFMQDRKVRIEVGYGLESALTDADSSRIITSTIVPRMRSNDVDGAVSSGVAAILTTITPSYRGVTPLPAATSGASLTWEGVILLVGLVLLFIFVFVAIVRTVMRGGRHGDYVTSGRNGGGFFSSGGSSSSSSDDSSSDDDFDAGGGSFGGGGASGSW